MDGQLELAFWEIGERMGFDKEMGDFICPIAVKSCKTRAISVAA